MSRHIRPFLLYWGPVIVYMAVIFAGSSASHLPELPSGITDKMAHFTEYALLGLLLTRALSGPRWLSISWPYVIGAIALAALYGASDEWHQWFVPGRDADVRDFAFDVMGASVSAGALWAWGILRRNS